MLAEIGIDQCLLQLVKTKKNVRWQRDRFVTAENKRRRMRGPNEYIIWPRIRSCVSGGGCLKEYSNVAGLKPNRVKWEKKMCCRKYVSFAGGSIEVGCDKYLVWFYSQTMVVRCGWLQCTSWPFWNLIIPSPNIHVNWIFVFYCSLFVNSVYELLITKNSEHI